jgi:hypothetical protein
MDFNQISDNAACKFFNSLDGGFYEGEILGKNKSGGDEFVWAVIPDLKSVFQFHPSNAAVEGGGEVVFSVYDRKMSLRQVANQELGDVSEPMFGYARNPDDMLRKVKILSLVLS